LDRQPALRPIHNVLEQRDRPKLFLPSMEVVEGNRGDKHDRNEKERQHPPWKIQPIAAVQ
jgi:hypothetical protein